MKLKPHNLVAFCAISYIVSFVLGCDARRPGSGYRLVSQTLVTGASSLDNLNSLKKGDTNALVKAFSNDIDSAILVGSALSDGELKQLTEVDVKMFRRLVAHKQSTLDTNFATGGDSLVAMRRAAVDLLHKKLLAEETRRGLIRQ